MGHFFCLYFKCIVDIHPGFQNANPKFFQCLLIFMLLPHMFQRISEFIKWERRLAGYPRISYAVIPYKYNRYKRYGKLWGKINSFKWEGLWPRETENNFLRKYLTDRWVLIYYAYIYIPEYLEINTCSVFSRWGIAYCTDIFFKHVSLVLALLVLFIIDYKFIHLWSRAGMKRRQWRERRKKIIRPQIKGHFAISRITKSTSCSGFV